MKDLVEIEVELDEELITSIEHYCGKKLTDKELGEFVSAVVTQELGPDTNWEEWAKQLKIKNTMED